MAKKNKKKEDKTPDFMTWKNRIDWNMSITENQIKKRQFEKLKDYVRGSYHKWLKVSIPVSIVNMAYSIIKTLSASLYIRDPYFAVNPLTKDDIPSAILQEQLINSDWKKLRIKREIKKAIEESGTVGRGYVKIGYTAKIGEEEAKGEYNEFIEEESIWGVHIPSEQIGYDLEAKDAPFDARYMYHWYYKPTDWLNEKYADVIGDDKINPTSKYETESGKQSKNELDNNRSKVVEIWEKETGYKLVYTDGWDGGWLESIPPVEKGCIGPYKIKGYPISLLKFEDETGSEDNLPLSPLEMVVWQIEEKIKMRSMQLNHVKRFSRQVFAKANSIEPPELEKFTEGVDGAVIIVNDNPANVVYVPAYPPIQTDIYAIENKIDLDLSTVFGQTGADRGGQTQTKTRTASELEIIQQGTANRNMERQDRVETFCENIARGLIGLERQFYDAEQYVKIHGEVPKEFLQAMAVKGKFDGTSLKFNKEDIRGDYDIDIKVGSTLPLDKAGRERRVMEWLRFGPALGLGPGSFTSFAIGQELARDSEMKPVEEAFQLDMQVLAQKMKDAKKKSPEEQLKMQKQVMDLKKGQKNLEVADNRMASNTQSTISKALKNNDAMDGTQQKLSQTQSKLNIAKTIKDLRTPTNKGK